MSISSVSSGNLLNQVGNSGSSQRRTDFQQLASALQSGNLSSAQQAFDQLQSDLGTNSVGGGSPNAATSTNASPLQTLVSQVGSALQSGNLSAAQQAFSSFQQQAATGVRGGHHHHHGGGESQGVAATAGSASVPSSSSTQTTGTSATTDSAVAGSGQDVGQALHSFMHALFQALGSAGGNSASQAQAQASTGGDADGDNDGSGSAVEAANGSKGYGDMATRLQNLIQSIASGSAATTAGGGSGAVSDLNSAFQNLTQALQGSDGSGTVTTTDLQTFLKGLAENLQSTGSGALANAGTVVNTTA